MNYIKIFLFFALLIQNIFASQENISLVENERFTNLKMAEERLNFQRDPFIFDDVLSLLKYLKDSRHWTEQKIAQKFEASLEEVDLLVNSEIACYRLIRHVHNYYIQGGVSLITSDEKENKWYSFFQNFYEKNKRSKTKSS